MVETMFSVPIRFLQKAYRTFINILILCTLCVIYHLWIQCVCTPVCVHAHTHIRLFMCACAHVGVCIYVHRVFVCLWSDGAVSGPFAGSGERGVHVRRHSVSDRTGSQRAGQPGHSRTG